MLQFRLGSIEGTGVVTFVTFIAALVVFTICRKHKSNSPEVIEIQQTSDKMTFGKLLDQTAFPAVNRFHCFNQI
jgi:hypothetical protein